MAVNLGSAVGKIILDTSGVSKGVKEAQGALGKLGSVSAAAGKALTAGLTLPLVGIGAASLKMAADFDGAMRNVNAVAQLPEKQFESLRQRVIDFSLTTRASAGDVAGALYNVVSAGFATEDAFKLMESASRAAGAGLAQTADTSRLLIAAMRAYHLDVSEAGRVTDIFLQTVNQGITTLPELASSMGRILPTASNLGVSLEETSFALARMTQTGLSTDEAVTRLNMLFTAMIKPSEELQAAIEKLGFSSGTALVEGAGGALNALQKLRDAGFLDTNEAVAALFPNIRAMGGALALINDDAAMAAGAVQQFGEAAAGAVERAREQQYASLSAQLAKLKSAFEAIGIAIGTQFIPPLVNVVEKLVPLVQGIGKIDPALLKLATTLGLVAAALGPGLLLIVKLASLFAPLPGVISAVVGALGSLAAGASLVAGAFGTGGLSAAVTAVVALLGGPLTVAIAGVGLAVAGLALAWKNNWLGIRDITQSVAADIKAAADNLAGGFAELAVPEAFQADLERTGAAAEEAAKKVVHSAQQISQAAEDAFFGWGPSAEQAAAALQKLADDASSADVVLTRFATETETTFSDVFPQAAEKAAALGVAIEGLAPTMDGFREAQQRMADAMATAWQKLQQDATQAVAGLLQVEDKYQDDILSVVKAMQQQIAQAQAAGETDRVKQLQIGMQQQIVELARGYQEQIEVQKKALAEMVLNQVQKWVLMGDITTEQAQQMTDAIESQYGVMVDAAALGTTQMLIDLTRWKDGQLDTEAFVTGSLDRVTQVSREAARAYVQHRQAQIAADQAFRNAYAQITSQIIGMTADMARGWAATGARYAAYAASLGADTSNIRAAASNLDGLTASLDAAAAAVAGGATTAATATRSAMTEAQRQAKAAADVSKNIADAQATQAKAWLATLKALKEIGQTELPDIATEVFDRLRDYASILLTHAIDLTSLFTDAAGVLNTKLVEAVSATADATSKAAGSLADVASAFKTIHDIASGEEFGGTLPAVSLETAFVNLRDLALSMAQRMIEVAQALDQDLLPAADAASDTAGKAASALSGAAKSFADILAIVGDEAFGGMFPAVDPAHAFVNLRDIVHGMVLRMIELAQELDQDLLDSTSAAMEAVNKATSALAGVVDALTKLVDFGALEADISQMQRSALAGAARVLLLLKAVALAISGMFRDPRFVVAPIEEGVQALLENWSKAIGPLSSAIDGIGKLIDFSQVEDDTMQMQRDALAGAARVMLLLKSIAIAIGGMFSDPRFAPDPISEEVQALLDNWSAALAPLTSAADAIDKIINTDLSKFESVMVTRLVGAMQVLARSVDSAVSQLESESAGILDRLKAASEKLQPLGDAIGSVVDAISSVFDLGGLGRETRQTAPGGFHNQGYFQTFDTFATDFAAGIERLKSGLEEIAGKLEEIAGDTALMDAITNAASIQDAVAGLQSAVDSIASAISGVVAVGVEEGDIGAGLTALRANLAAIAESLSGVDVPAIDIGWLTSALGMITSALLNVNWGFIASSAVNGIANGVYAAIGGVDAAFSALLNDIYAWIDDLNAALAEVPQPASPLPELANMISGIEAAAAPMAAAWQQVAAVNMAGAQMVAAPVPAAPVAPAGTTVNFGDTNISTAFGLSDIVRAQRREMDRRMAQLQSVGL